MAFCVSLSSFFNLFSQSRFKSQLARLGAMSTGSSSRGGRLASFMATWSWRSAASEGTSVGLGLRGSACKMGENATYCAKMG